jgi:hypothetical protein
MRRRLASLCAVAAGLATAPAAMADHWPMAGGGPSRSSNAATAPGDTPIAPAWQAFDGRVRTPMTITGGGGPDVQRVAYGTADGRVHVRVLATGAPVGPAEGLNIDEGNLVQGGGLYGSEGTVGFADTSTEDRLGQLLVVHNDDSLGTQRVYIARISLTTGQVVSDTLVPAGAADCAIDSSPLLTPASASGGRLLYFVLLCSRRIARYLVRVPIQGDAASPDAVIGDPGFAYIPDAVEVASPAAVVLRDPAGVPRFHVAVARTGRLDIFSGDDALDASPSTSERAPALTAPLEAADEVPRTPAAPSTPAGAVAGSQGSGTEPASAVYVAAEDADGTKVYRFVQDGSNQTLRVAKAAHLGADSGEPAPGLAVAETMTAAGPSPGGLLVVTHEGNLTLLRSADLGIVRSLSGAPLPAGSGFRRNVAAVSGAFVYVTRDGSDTAGPEHLALRLDGLAPLAGADFQRAEDRAPSDQAPRTGQASSQPAISHGHPVFGGAAGTFAYRSRDAAVPAVTITSPAADGDVSGNLTISARAVDSGGVDGVTFRLSTDAGSSRTLGRVTQANPGSSFADATFSLPFSTASVANGGYFIEAVAVDKGGNIATSEKRRIRILNPLAMEGLRPGACLNPLTGSAAADRITGSAGGDRILGGGGDDRLDGAGGHDCVLGEAGADVLSGGSGDDVIDGGVGEDVLAGGSGRNRIDGGAGADVARGGGGAERVSGGSGNDTLLAGRGNDTISGGSGKDTLKGEQGNDRISGGSGHDAITGGSGANRLDGGSGNDRISAFNKRRDVITCGKGRDRVTADRRDKVSRTCERVTRRGRR